MTYLLIINLIAFGVWGLDKYLARLVEATGSRDLGGRSHIAPISRYNYDPHRPNHSHAP